MIVLEQEAHIKKLPIKTRFLSEFPVIGPYTDIEADLMLAGKKPLTWTLVVPEDCLHEGIGTLIEHEGRKRLDKAVEEGRLISRDVEVKHPDSPAEPMIFRHYAQPDKKDSLKQMADFNTAAFNFKDVSRIHLDKSIGEHLGYRKRDRFLFENVINNPLLPDKIKDFLIDMNAACQQALREKLLHDAGYKLDKWEQNIGDLKKDKRIVDPKSYNAPAP